MPLVSQNAVCGGCARRGRSRLPAVVIPLLVNRPLHRDRADERRWAPTLRACRPSIRMMTGELAAVAPADGTDTGDDRLTALFDAHHRRLYVLARRLSSNAEDARDLVPHALRQTDCQAKRRTDDEAPTLHRAGSVSRPRSCSHDVAIRVPASSQLAPKPVVETQIRVNPIMPPPTVPEMVAQADAVLVGRYLPGARFLGSQTDRFGMPRPPMTLHPFEIVTVVRAHFRLPPPGDTIAIELLGGKREHPTHIERFAGTGLRRLGVGRLYATFLAWNEHRDMFETA